VTTLEEASFFFSKKPKCHPINLFGDDESLLANKPTNANNWPEIQNGKNICHALVFKFFTQQQNKWEAGRVLLANILPPTNVTSPTYGRIYIIILGPIKNCKQYEIIINNFPTCNCMDFVLMMIGSLGASNKWAHCKHLCIVLHLATCDVMWVNENVHSSFNLELE
jgi:hypothetical protein